MKKMVTMPGLTMTVEVMNELMALAREVWNEIGYDTLAAVAEADGKDVNSVSIPRAEVVELVLGEVVERMTGPYVRSARELSTPARLFLTHAPYEQQCAVISKAFPYSRYGM